MCKLTKIDFASSFNVSVDEFSEDLINKIEVFDFRYELVEGENFNQLVLDSLKVLDDSSLSCVGAHRIDVWEKGWEENYQEFVSSNYKLSALVPKYYNAHGHLRYKGQFIKPVDPCFEINFYTIFRIWLFQRYLSGIKNIYELGCGTGLNLVLLAKLFPKANLFGLDWAYSSQQIMSALAENYNWKIKGFQFDFFEPQCDIPILDKSAILTMTALEQIGDSHGKLLDFIFERNPAICINVEPIVELYDDNQLLDYLAIRYHKKRGYLSNYLTTLREFEREGKVEMICVHKINFGGFLNESFSIVIWKPINR